MTLQCTFDKNIPNTSTSNKNTSYTNIPNINSSDISIFELISLLSSFFNSIVKVMIPFYNMSKVDNHQITTYYIHHKEKLEIIKSIYKFCFYISNFLRIKRMQIYNILILANKFFISNKKIVIKVTKIIIKDYKYFIFIQSIKFNKV